MEAGTSRPTILQNRQSMLNSLCQIHRLTPPCDRRTPNALQILLDVEHLEARPLRDQLAHGVGLANAEFEDQQAACLESTARLIDEPPDDRQSVLSREERDGRLMIAYFGL